MIGLIDCTSFYCSCERAFRPDLNGKPIVVLSNNDGCVISRSREAQHLGVRMGEPYHKIQEACERQNVAVFSSNYNLYADMSRRINIILERYSEKVERYSIDESFIEISAPPKYDNREYFEIMGRIIRDNIFRSTGIPVRVSFAETKTLAKVGSEYTKYLIEVGKEPTVCWYAHPDLTRFMGAMSVGEVWGVGPRMIERLNEKGIYSALDLAHADPSKVRKIRSIQLMATALELRGNVSFPINEHKEPPKSIIRSRMFARRLTDPAIIGQAISAHTVRAVEKARWHNLDIRYLTVWGSTGKHPKSERCYVSLSVPLERPTNDTYIINNLARQLWKAAYVPTRKDGSLIRYARAGVTLSGLIPHTSNTEGLFDSLSGYEIDTEGMLKRRKALDAIDHVNSKHGRFSMVFASMGTPDGLRAMIDGKQGAVKWAMKRNMMSPRYTTNWNEIMKVYVK